jgi:hypothetical protein
MLILRLVRNYDLSFYWYLQRKFYFYNFFKDLTILFFPLWKLLETFFFFLKIYSFLCSF